MMTQPQPNPLTGTMRPAHLAYSAYCWLLVCIIALVFVPIIVAWPGSLARRRQFARCGARLLFHLARLPLHAEGLDRLPRGTHILIANHASFLDALILSAVLPASPGYAFVARQEFRSQVFLWPLLHAVGTIILRKEPGQAAHPGTEQLATALENGENLIIFPEGAIERSPGIRPFHSGAFVAATRCRVPVVLASIKGARQALPLKNWKPVRTPITVIIGAAFAPDRTDPHAAERMARMARMSVASFAGEDVVPAAGGEA